MVEEETTAEDDPTTIQSLALSPEDVVNAYAYTRENPGEAVLRATPPFHGRMRARIHVYHRDDTELTGAVHVRPDDLIEDDVCAAYPSLEDARSAADSDPASGGDATDEETERLRKRHADAVERWQARARDALVDAVALETDAGTHRVAVKRVG
ncbi:hypothetical protein [Natronolimnohabitans innermongolicus]|uniref:DUF8009 domain-containing protein n=1 Tax=Natronolimnohabitans innermongolicus JCM 12255 TaxID=1227499 RepID=L9WS30_9EURY|nr:hypothetical protein [Natronolimnohabitans innermongolicus]ELY52242.1 hypothetical protein C493_16379 [Natronolimnohabitans innermongolicus JCM 12255]